MEREIYSDYVAYEIHYYYDKHPDGPDRCPMCGGDLSRSDIEPSRAMRDEMAPAATTNESGIYIHSNGSWLHTCNRCRWWCVREGCQYIDTTVTVFHYSEYLIFAIVEKSEQSTLPNIPESTQPWLKALDDPDVYDLRVLRSLPKLLAGFIYKQSHSPKAMPGSQPVIKDMSECDRFFNMTRELVARHKEKKLHKTEHLKLRPGDKIRIRQHAYRGNGIGITESNGTIVATEGSIGTVLSYDEYHEAMHEWYKREDRKYWKEYLAGEKSSWLAWHFPQVKEWMKQGTCYPIEFESLVPPSEDELAFWKELRQYTHVAWEYRDVQTAWVVEVDCLEKITNSAYIKFAAELRSKGKSTSLAHHETHMSQALFDPHRDPATDLLAALIRARREHKNIVLDVGGDWCVWCKRFEQFIASHPVLQSLCSQYYVTTRLYFGEGGEEMEFFRFFPEIQSVPHLFIMNPKGEIICSQPTDPLEQGNSYNIDRVHLFFQTWINTELPALHYPHMKQLGTFIKHIEATYGQS